MTKPHQLSIRVTEEQRGYLRRLLDAERRKNPSYKISEGDVLRLVLDRAMAGELGQLVAQEAK